MIQNIPLSFYTFLHEFIKMHLTNIRYFFTICMENFRSIFISTDTTLRGLLS